MAGGHSFTGRIIVAIVLMIGFYVLAAAIAGGLMFIPIAEVMFAGRLHIKLAVICVVAGVMILWSVMPRIDRFTAPGPLLTEAEQPELFRQLRDIAQATGQEMPVEVYAVLDMNA